MDWLITQLEYKQLEMEHTMSPLLFKVRQRPANVDPLLVIQRYADQFDASVLISERSSCESIRTEIKRALQHQQIVDIVSDLCDEKAGKESTITWGSTQFVLEIQSDVVDKPLSELLCSEEWSGSIYELTRDFNRKLLAKTKLRGTASLQNSFDYNVSFF